MLSQLDLKQSPIIRLGAISEAPRIAHATLDKLHLKLNGDNFVHGYGFLCDSWYDTPSPYYMNLPIVEEASTRFAIKKSYIEGI